MERHRISVVGPTVKLFDEPDHKTAMQEQMPTYEFCQEMELVTRVPKNAEGKHI